jgi:hypothetical protein
MTSKKKTQSKISTTKSKAPSKKAKADDKAKADEKATPKKRVPLNYDPASEFKPPATDSKGDHICRAFLRPEGVVAEDLVNVLRELNKRGKGKQSPETKEYALSWRVKSYLYENFGLGMKSQYEDDGELRMWGKMPKGAKYHTRDNKKQVAEKEKAQKDQKAA